MALVHCRLPNPNFTVPHLICSRTRNLRLPAMASISYPQIDVNCPESELRARGISFTPIGDSCVVRLAHASGTAAKVLLPSGLITSFKPRMWHGGTMELLHTLVSSRQTDADANAGTGALIQGGLSLALRIQNDDAEGVSWCPDAWTLDQVSGSRRESIQVELIGRNAEAGNGDQEVKHIISLGRDFLTSEVVVRNSATTTLILIGSALCHLAVSTPDATYAVGLEGSNLFVRPPFVSDFSIIPPDRPNFVWPSSVEDGMGEEEEDGNKHLTEKLSMVYVNAPRTLTIVDRGRRNSVAMRRIGYDEVYMFSPGSEHEWYNKYSFVCIGHAALLKPVILNAQSEWRGVLQVLNPNS